MNMTRKEFLGSLLGVAAGGLVLAACGGDDGGSDTPDAATANRCEMNGTNVNIASNHGHVLMVSKDDVAAGVDKTYDITGTSDHAHSVTVTAANFGKLAMNQSLQLTSTSGGGHTHGVTIMCA